MHFELTSVHGERQEPGFTFLHVEMHFPWRHLLLSTVLFPVNVVNISITDQVAVDVGSTSRIPILFY